jgi:hypothetical protein
MVADDVERPDPLLLLRRAVAVRGTVGLAVECSPRFDYARRAPGRESAGSGVVFRCGDERLALAADRPLDWDGERARLELAAGEVVWFAMGYGGTRGYWRDWLLQSETRRARRGPSIVYRLQVPEPPGDEVELAHLSGTRAHGRCASASTWCTTASTTSTASCSMRCSPCRGWWASSASRTGQCCARCSTR